MTFLNSVLKDCARAAATISSCVLAFHVTEGVIVLVRDTAGKVVGKKKEEAPAPAAQAA